MNSLNLVLLGLFLFFLSPRMAMDDWPQWVIIGLGALAAIVYEWRSNEKTLGYLIDHETRLTRLECGADEIE